MICCTNTFIVASVVVDSRFVFFYLFFNLSGWNDHAFNMFIYIIYWIGQRRIDSHAYAASSMISSNDGKGYPIAVAAVLLGCSSFFLFLWFMWTAPHHTTNLNAFRSRHFDLDHRLAWILHIALSIPFFVPCFNVICALSIYIVSFLSSWFASSLALCKQFSSLFFSLCFCGWFCLPSCVYVYPVVCFVCCTPLSQFQYYYFVCPFVLSSVCVLFCFEKNFYNI